MSCDEAAMIKSRYFKIQTNINILQNFTIVPAYFVLSNGLWSLSFVEMEKETKRKMVLFNKVSEPASLCGRMPLPF